MTPPADNQVDLFISSTEQVYTVSDLTGQVRTLLEEQFGVVRVVGEISNLSVAASGHMYLSLKDDKAAMPSVMFRSAVDRLAEIPEEGQEVECLGRLTLYEPRGRTQLVIEWMVPRGEGALELRFQQLKTRLAAEGLFDPERKRPLPSFPACIGVVTSPTGAAIRDILKILGQRFPSVPVLIYPTRVQGDGAAAEIAKGIERLGDGNDCDVLITGRGGGSAEDLWAFNEEIVVRAIVNSRVPVISAVGHEVDIVLSDLAADARAPTPTAAAEMVVPDREQWKDHLVEQVEGVRRLLSLRVSRARQELTGLARRVRDPRLVLAAHRMRLDDCSRALARNTREKTETARRSLTNLRLALASQGPGPMVRFARERLGTSSRRLVGAITVSLKERKLWLQGQKGSVEKLDPSSVLARGYSVVSRADGGVVTKFSQVRPGNSIRVRLHRGGLEGTVEKVHPAQEASDENGGQNG